MSRLISDLLAYLKAVFVETWQIVFTLFDILGIALFLYPKLASGLVNDESLIRIVGGLIFFASCIWANFSLYRKLTDVIADHADIRLKVLEQGFSSSYNCGRSPFHDAPENPHGVNEQGLPDWCYVWAKIEIENIGYEKGRLVSELDNARTSLPSLFARDTIKVSCPTENLEGRKAYNVDCFFDVRLAERDPHAFAKSLKDLVRRKQSYKVVLRYKTNCFGSESQIRRLVIKGDLQGFYEKMITYWDENHFKELADLANLLSTFGCSCSIRTRRRL